MMMMMMMMKMKMTYQKKIDTLVKYTSRIVFGQQPTLSKYKPKNISLLKNQKELILRIGSYFRSKLLDYTTVGLGLEYHKQYDLFINLKIKESSKAMNKSIHAYLILFFKNLKYINSYEKKIYDDEK